MSTTYSVSPIPWAWACHQLLHPPPKDWLNAWMKCGCLAVVSKSYIQKYHKVDHVQLTHHRKVSWSRMGSVAYISPDGLRVGLRYLQCSQSDGKWQLSDESPMSSVTESHGGAQLVNLSWNESGSDLAVVDCFGRISIHSVSIALNSMTCFRQPSSDSSDDSNQIVGMMWLNTSRSVSHRVNGESSPSDISDP